MIDTFRSFEFWRTSAGSLHLQRPLNSLCQRKRLDSGSRFDAAVPARSCGCCRACWISAGSSLWWWWPLVRQDPLRWCLVNLSDTVSTLQLKHVFFFFFASYCAWWPGADTALRNTALSAHGRQSRWRSVVQLAGAMISSLHDMQHLTMNDVTIMMLLWSINAQNMSIFEIVLFY